MERKYPTSFRFSPEFMALLALLAKELGLSKQAVLELLVRERAKKEGVK